MHSANQKEAFVAQKILADPTFREVTHLSKPRNVLSHGFGAWEGMIARDPLLIPVINGSARDTGETKVVNAAMDEFRRRGWKTEIMAVGDGLPLLRNDSYIPERLGRPERVIADLTGQALITGFSGEDNLAAAMSARADQFGTDQYRIEDFMGALGKNMQDYYGADFGRFIPSRVFVANQWAADQNSKYFPKDKIEIAGPPSIPALDTEQQSRTRRNLRERLGIAEDRLVVAWFGQVGKATVKAMEIFLEGLGSIEQPFDLLIRFHPIFIKANDHHVVLPLLEKFGNNVHHVSGIELPGIRHEKVSNVNDVIDAMDLGGNERSTVANEAAARRRLMISLDMDGFDKLYGLDQSFAVPAIERGASPVIRRRDEIQGAVKAYLYDEGVRSSHFKAMKEFESDGLGAFNIVNRVERDIFLSNLQG